MAPCNSYPRCAIKVGSASSEARTSLFPRASTFRKPKLQEVNLPADGGDALLKRGVGHLDGTVFFLARCARDIAEIRQ